ncbi:hypothetical protein C1922_07485 [Stenotrophomonas sp. ZAC14D2_NAIMI4_7]|uniref:hypothetical protein n=1 Tax=Stenotrophomonas sp. ZAC14D2_NAIMI4_7 TaxID=2072405 RepID=UPI000D54207C|nr:hypothetical protein [Stenotrophomonas sp. ZAC14D2_NAIMI4_7]AWH17169.1 hypothetical protein C1922_07485 [Stenotrophomonas sp. ZAC14D2_NAIMI4_7]
MKIPEFMQSDTYAILLDKLDRHIPEKIDRRSEVHGSIINLMEKWMQHASLSCDELLHTALNHQEHLVAYIVEKQAAYSKPNGGRDNMISHAPKKNFPIGHIIEYHLLLHGRMALLQYMRKIRMPDPEKYTMDIESIFKETKSA